MKISHLTLLSNFTIHIPMFHIKYGLLTLICIMTIPLATYNTAIKDVFLAKDVTKIGQANWNKYVQGYKNSQLGTCFNNQSAEYLS